MDKIIKQLFKIKDNKTTNYGKGQEVGYSLEPINPKVKQLIKKANRICLNEDYFTLEDIIQEVALIITSSIDNLIQKGQITMDYLEENLNDFNDENLKLFWGYVDASLQYHIKDQIKYREKKAAEDILGGKVNTILFSTLENKNALNNYNVDELIDNFIFNNSNIYSEELSNPFNQWFRENKEEILTKKQLRFYNLNGIGYRRDNAYLYRKNIAKRIMIKYNEYYSASTLKEIENKRNIEILEDLLENDFINKLKKYIDEDIVLNIIYSNKTSLEDKKAINDLIDNRSNILPLDTLIRIKYYLEEKLEELDFDIWCKENIC